jgi:GNAT superfamily N-acetyltransferase
VQIVPLSSSPETVSQLAEIIIEAVAGGASLHFMHPLAREDAEAFWAKSLKAADAGERIVLGAMLEGRIIGTTTLHLDTPPNQPHRAEVAKMITREAFRGRGVGTALIREAERIAVARGCTLLTLDSATVDGAGPFYEKLGFVPIGVIPRYAFTPSGAPSGTIFFYKDVGA